MKHARHLFIAILLFALLLEADAFSTQTIAEKKESLVRDENEMDPGILEQLRYVNQLLEEKHLELLKLYGQVQSLYQTGASLREYESLLHLIQCVKTEVAEIQEMWREESSSLMQGEEYALWHQPDTNVQQLLMDYGAADHLYLIAPELASLRLSLNSNLPIPRQSWGECLELILAQYGLGIREINPYLREIYLLNSDTSALKGITDQVQDLDLYPSRARVCFVVTASAADPRADLLFLQRFSNPATMRVEMLGGKIFLTGFVEAIQELLKLYSFAGAGSKQQEFQLVTLSKLDAREMEVILRSAFYDGGMVPPEGEGSSLRAIALENLPQSLFLTGSKEDVKKAFQLIQDVESQIENKEEKTLFWYTAKHSDSEELAALLARVYDLLIGQEKGGTASEKQKRHLADSGLQGESKNESSGLSVPAIQIAPGSKGHSHKTADGQNNFIVDPKTGSIIMVVKREALPQIKALLKKLDVPKKMVQIEVLLFEKKVSNSNKFGLNLLRLGRDAGNLAQHADVFWTGDGILEFLLSHRKGSGIPAYDLAYQFMLAQEDVQINASPSVTTMNQTPATIAIVEEVSIDSGVNSKKNRIYTRAQYGITIQITPTINMDDPIEGSEAFVTLETDLTFDTPKKSANDRPDVIRRHIKNHVRIRDRETLILGGLRRKSSQDNQESLPFLGEIPGIGKLFSHTEMNDNSTEMFVFITPKILSDPIEGVAQVCRDELKRRPGDLPEFLQELAAAQNLSKKRLFAGSLAALFGREDGPAAPPPSTHKGEYDGR